MARETKWADVKVIEKVDCSAIQQHISTTIKVIGVDSLTGTCLHSQLHCSVISV